MKDNGRKRKIYPPAFKGRIREERIELAHGAGGMKMHRLIAEIFMRHFGNPMLNRLEDSAVVALPQGEVCFTTDSFVVKPMFFPGGDIGKLAVCGTVNDLTVVGATPLYMAVSFVLREGLPLATLERVCRSIRKTASAAGVMVVTGDTKVIEGNGEEEMFITTSGIGIRARGLRLGGKYVERGDVLILSGGLGEHEAAVAIARGGYHFRATLTSDCAPLNQMVLAALRVGGIKLMRDPTRGGLATTLNEFSRECGFGFVVDEKLVPVKRTVQGVAMLLGLDPLYMANEGKVVMVVAKGRVEPVLRVLRRFPHGRGAKVIGDVVEEPVGVWVKTKIGSLRRLLMLEGEQLPRIC
ncbi:MAG: hydrogenase expression/formation protein HypE [bacterium]